ncbi:MAG: hypothetical protein ACON5H_01105 [Akkermansiaceae bacterium]
MTEDSDYSDSAALSSFLSFTPTGVPLEALAHPPPADFALFAHPPPADTFLLIQVSIPIAGKTTN